MTRPTLALCAALLTLAIALPAQAAQSRQTRVVKCGEESCLLITGRRDRADAAVSLNGQPLATKGGTRWRARLPVRTVRALSAPYARSVTVAVGDQSREVKLPIGLLGHTENLAMLVVRAK